MRAYLLATAVAAAIYSSASARTLVTTDAASPQSPEPLPSVAQYLDLRGFDPVPLIRRASGTGETDAAAPGGKRFVAYRQQTFGSLFRLRPSISESVSTGAKSTEQATVSMTVPTAPGNLIGTKGQLFASTKRSHSTAATAPMGFALRLPNIVFPPGFPFLSDSIGPVAGDPPPNPAAGDPSSARQSPVLVVTDPAPEPETWGLMILAFFGLALFQRRRFRSA